MFWSRPFGPGRWNRRSGIRDVQPVPWPASPTLTAGLHLEVQLHGGDAWTDIIEDVMLQDYELLVDRGIRGAGPLDLVASTGTLQFTLQNRAETVSGQRLGYYSPEHADVRPGWGLGIGCRLSYWISGTPYYLFRGWIEDIDPVLERHRETVTVMATDYMNELARHVPNVSIQVNKRADEVLAAVVAAVPKQPAGTSFDVGDSTFAYAMDNAQGLAGMSIAQQIALSEYGGVFVKGDGTVRMLKRSARFSGTSRASFSDDMTALRVPQSRQRLITRVRATTHPRRVDASDTNVLFSNQRVPSIAAGETLVLNGTYNDPANRASRVGGTDMRAPVAATDYLMNAAEDGSGADLTANFTVQATYSASSVEYRITNNGVTLGYVTLLQARGRGLYDYDPVDSVRAADDATILKYGSNLLVIDMPYQSDQGTADAVADYIKTTWSTPGAIQADLEFWGGKSDAYLLHAVSREIGEVVDVIETASGISHAYFINAVSLRFVMGKKPWCTWTLARVLSQNFLTLDDATLGQLDDDPLAPL